MQPAAAHAPATKDRILDAAEKFFAVHGFDATSIRMIATAANVNLAAINYHFQSKEALLQAVYSRRVAPINERRLELLRQYIGTLGDWPLEPEPILEAFSQPVLEVIHQAPHIPMLMVRMIYFQDRETFRQIFESLFRSVGVEFLKALGRALPHLTEAQLFLRMQFFFGSFVQMMAARDAMASINNFGAIDQNQMVRQLIHYTSAGLRAPAVEIPR
ncbi:MAG: TetR/AcrR family transcriptional regulator [Bryobacterales bacterium]|nr:TetR/AcrR family transcriptional regulator [Bryobacterales bacterium]